MDLDHALLFVRTEAGTFNYMPENETQILDCIENHIPDDVKIPTLDDFVHGTYTIGDFWIQYWLIFLEP